MSDKSEGDERPEIPQVLIEEYVLSVIDKALSLDTTKSDFYDRKTALGKEVAIRLFSIMRTLQEDPNKPVVTDEYYENLLFSVQDDQLKRTYGFASAEARIGEAVRQLNERLDGDIAEYDPNEDEIFVRLLNKLTFVRSLGYGMGVPPAQVDEISTRLIDSFLKKDG